MGDTSVYKQLAPVCSGGRIGRPSLTCLPNTVKAGEHLVIGSIVFLYDMMALWKLSTSSEPNSLVLSVIILLTCLTPSSARQLECANATEETLWWTCQLARNSWVSLEVNSVPWSLEISSGTPYVENISLKCFINPFAPF